MWVPLTRPSRRLAVVAAVIVGVALAVSALAGLLNNAGGAYGDAIRGMVQWAPFVLLLAISFPVAIAIAARPQIGVLLIAALVPYNGLLVIVKHPPFTEGYKEALTIYVLVWSVLNVIGKRRTKERYPRYVAPLAFYVLIGIVSAARVGGVNGMVGLKTSFFYLLIPIALWLCPFTKKDRDWLVSIIMVDAFITSLYGLYQQVIGASGLLSLGYQYGTSIRTTGPWLRSFSSFSQHSAFGLFLTMALLIGTSVSLADTKRLRSKLFLLVSPVILLALALTFVRSAWLGLAVGAIYLAIHRYRVLLFFAPFALVGLLVLPLSFEKGAFYSGSFQERQTSWTQNLNRAANPFGNGLGTTGSAAEKSLQVKKLTTDFYQPDNNYYKVLYELGVLGLFFFAMMLIAAFLYTREVEIQVAGADQALIIGVSATILAVMIAAYTAVYFEIFPNDVFFWLLLGTVTSCVRESS
ncbi:MAG: putative rane protein [Actinomycetia bacterium]|nr:putative rane protein [Actinomycetes bacterium]